MVAIMAITETPTLTDQLKKLIGRQGSLRIPSPDRKQEEIEIPVRVLDVRVAFGTPRYKVRPVAGKGEWWVQEGRFQVDEK